MRWKWCYHPLQTTVPGIVTKLFNLQASKSHNEEEALKLKEVIFCTVVYTYMPSVQSKNANYCRTTSAELIFHVNTEMQQFCENLLFLSRNLCESHGNSSS